jgi:signal transduction histidine kinase
MAAEDPTPDEPAGTRLPAPLNAASLGVTIGFGVTAAIVFSPMFVTPFVELLGRTLVLAFILLAVFVGAQRWPERWLPRWFPRWLFTTLAVALAAPLATFLIYLVLVGGDLRMLVGSEPRMTGLVLLGGSALVLGLVVTLSALLREREARARSLALQFELERNRLARQAVDAQLARLQAQIEPHFLFNTLANVQALVESGSPRAAPVLRSLIAYLRAAMPRLHGAEATLGDEIALARAYLELMQMRMPDRLRFEIAVEPALAARRFPPMALLTLVENAVRHGIDPAEDGGRIEIGGRIDPARGTGSVWVADSGVGLAEQAEPGIGLTNLRERLRAFYGAGAELRLAENSPRGLKAEIVIPA